MKAYCNSEVEGYLITIIIPHRDSPDTLKILLNSIPSEERVDIIVVDDKSRPELNARHLVLEYPNVRFMENPGPEYNAGAARNFGLLHAKGDWFCFADSDDYFFAGSIESLIGEIPSFDNRVDIAFLEIASWDIEKHETGSRGDCLSAFIGACRKYGDDTLLRYKWSVPWGKLLRRSMVERWRIEFDSREAGNDVIFSLKCGYYARSVRCLPIKFYCVCESNGSLTSNLTPRRALDRLAVLSRYNSLAMNWRLNIDLDYGLSYFFKSLRLGLKGESISVYAEFLKMSLRRLVKM